MKTAVTLVIFLALTGWLSLPSVELHLALRGHGEQPARPAVVMLGDSHTDFVNWNIMLRCSGKIANMGVGGNTTAQMLARLPQVLELHPKMVVVMGGTNDALQHIDPETTSANLTRMEAETIAAGIRFVSLTPPPLGERPLGVGQVPIPFTPDDLLPDQVHLRASGYAKWRDAIAPLARANCS